MKSSKTVPYTKTEKKQIEQLANQIVSSKNIKKFKFPKAKVVKVITNLYKKNVISLTDCENELSIPSLLCYDKKSKGYTIDEAIISLVKKHKPNDMVTVGKKGDMAALIFGSVAEEICLNTLASIVWSKMVMNKDMATMPITIDINSKLKTLKNTTIANEMKRLAKNNKSVKTTNMKKNMVVKSSKKTNKKGHK